MSLSFMKTGAAAHEEMKKADAQQQANWEAANGPQRFWLQQGKDARLTFLDGTFEGGLLQSVSFYEHMVPRGAGKQGFDNFPCTQETEACPICEEANTPSLVFAFTVIDHRVWKDKNGKDHQFQKRLFICKRETFKRLQAKAEKMTANNQATISGLVGVTFDVSRIGDKSASVGSDFDFVACTPLKDVYTACGFEEKEQGAFNYAEVIKYFPAAELRGLGFGQKNSVGAADIKAAGTQQKTAAPAGASPFASPFNPSKEL